MPVPHRRQTFAGFPACDDLATLDADIAIISVPHGWPANEDTRNEPSAAAPEAIRASSWRYARFAGHYDVDFGGPIRGDGNCRIVDCGDVAAVPGDLPATSSAISTVLTKGAVPIVLGGDHSIPIPVLRAYAGRDSICVVQIDAHLDFRDEIDGVREGLSSGMRRASEMPHVSAIAAFGLRGIGSARPADYADALAWGAVHVTAREIHRDGMTAALRRLPAADGYYITLDIDGLDPSIAPGVLAPAFGGLTYEQVFDLITGVARRGPIVGMDIVEVVPERDVNDLTSALAARFAMVALGAMIQSGQFGRRSRIRGQGCP